MLCMNDCQLDCAVEDKLYRELSQLTKDKTIWREKIPYIGSFGYNNPISPSNHIALAIILGEWSVIKEPI